MRRQGIKVVRSDAADGSRRQDQEKDVTSSAAARATEVGVPLLQAFDMSRKAIRIGDGKLNLHDPHRVETGRASDRPSKKQPLHFEPLYVTDRRGSRPVFWTRARRLAQYKEKISRSRAESPRSSIRSDVVVAFVIQRSS